MEDITLSEIYIYNPKLFKTKNLKSFIKNHKIDESNVVKLKNNKIAINKNWIKKNLPSFNLKLNEFKNDNSFGNYFEIQPILEKYGCKVFNPINLNLDSTTVKYFLKNDSRTPYFTQKGLIKIMVFFNDIQSTIFNWIFELTNGQLQSQIDNLSNVVEMVNLNHVPVVKKINEKMTLTNHAYNVTNSDIIVDFKRISDLKKEINFQQIEDYKCPIFTQLQINFQNALESAQQEYNNKIKEIKQEKVIQHLQQELEKEKSLKDQAISLTQSFIPNMNSTFFNGEIKPSPSPLKSKLKPSKIQ